jgi:hypothetical protein
MGDPAGAAPVLGIEGHSSFYKSVDLGDRYPLVTWQQLRERVANDGILRHGCFFLSEVSLRF